jgi:hypothetical protein
MRRRGKLLPMVGLVYLGACASLRNPADDVALQRLFQGGEWVRTAASAHCYSRADVLRIEELREFGEPTGEVARVVGGAPPDIVELEQRLRYLRRDREGAILSAIRPGAEPCAAQARRE